jgi:hypothetical protein
VGEDLNIIMVIRINNGRNIMEIKILIGSIVVSVLVVLTSFPSVVTRQTYEPTEITSELREHLVQNLKNENGGLPLGWSPGLIINCFFITLRLYIDYLSNNSWFPGLTLIMTYLFLVLVVLSIIGSP